MTRPIIELLPVEILVAGFQEKLPRDTASFLFGLFTCMALNA
jgi:hypothetical protein